MCILLKYYTHYFDYYLGRRRVNEIEKDGEMKEKGETVEAGKTDLDEKEGRDNTGKTLKGKKNHHISLNVSTVQIL